jgi:hypothetical protein
MTAKTASMTAKPARRRRKPAPTPTIFDRVHYAISNAWWRVAAWHDRVWGPIERWRDRSAHDLALFVIGRDMPGFGFRVALLLAAVIVAVRPLVIGG